MNTYVQDQVDALKDKGNESFRQQDFSTAVAHYASAIELAEANGIDAVQIHSNRSVALLRLGETQAGDGMARQTFRRAIEEADKVIALHPQWNKGYFRKAEVHFAMRDFKQAEASYQKALELMPGDEHVKMRLEESRQAISGFLFKQLLCGRDVAVKPQNVVEQQVFGFASQMANFMYLVGDAATSECLVVDAAWDVPGILKVVRNLNLKLVGAVVTHYHFDHTGGRPPAPFDTLGITVSGIKDLADAGLPVYINSADADAVVKNNGVPRESMTILNHGESISVGRVKLSCLHTPGHTPGSMCLHIDGSTECGTCDGVGMLIAGDTLFKGSCGRLDLPDCDCDQMYNSLQATLGKLDDRVVVYPGHNYGGDKTTIGAERRAGLLRPMTQVQWRQMHKL